MSYCTAINCMDGRTQKPVIEYLSNHFDVQFVDMITEPGPNLILAKGEDELRLMSIFMRCDISIEKHQSVGIAIVGHHDCAGNPAADDEQRAHIKRSIAALKNRFSNIDIVGLWLDHDFAVQKL